MSFQEPQDIQAYCVELAERARLATRPLVTATPSKRTDALYCIAQRLLANVDSLKKANGLDLAAGARSRSTVQTWKRMRTRKPF